MASKAGSAASGAVAGAAAGSVLGPWGTAGGAIIGGIGGWLSGSSGPSDAEIAAQQAAAAERAHATGIARNAAEGRGPSAAQDLLNLNTGRANELAFSQAKGMAGANPALAAVMASNAAAQNSQAGIANAGALRAQEMNDARSQYLAATGVDVGQAQTRDAAQTAQSNLQSQYNTNLFNSAISGTAQAGGMIAGAQPVAATPAQPGAKPADWGVDPNKKVA